MYEFTSQIQQGPKCSRVFPLYCLQERLKTLPTTHKHLSLQDLGEGFCYSGRLAWILLFRPRVYSEEWPAIAS